MQIEIAEEERGGQFIVWIDSFLSNLATQLLFKTKILTLRGHPPWYIPLRIPQALLSDYLARC